MKYPIYFPILLCVSPTLPLPIHSSCSGVPTTTWNTDHHSIGPAIESWLHSIVSVSEGVDSVESMLYHPVTGEYSSHYAHYNDVLEENSHLVDTDRRVVTIGTYNTGFPSGLAWQWRSRRMAEGFLYGEVDRRGQFSGDNITFIYPDFVTGLRGRYEYGVLVWATAVKIVGERCREGIKEIMVETADNDEDVRWEKEEATQWYIGRHPQVMDPHERKSVYVGDSLIPGSDEGLFARRSFMPGDIVSYFSGTRTFARDMFFDNMTEAETSSAGAYFFNLAVNSPDWWGFPEDLVLDIPEEYRSIYKFRTTLGHKANHLFEGKNTEYDTVNHPVHGGIVCLIATEVINKDDEIYVDYLYDVDDEATEQWYKDLYDRTYG